MASVELKLHDIHQLFNAMDYSPLETRDLHPDIEEFIVSSMEEHPHESAVTMHVHLHEWPEQDPAELIPKAVHNYFAYRVTVSKREFGRLMKRGRTSLTIGLLFMVGCLLIAQLAIDGTGPWAAVARESLTIAGWVAMWRPMEIYLYDWWPLRSRGRTYAKLSEIEVEVMRTGES